MNQIKEDMYKSLCTSCFQQKAAFFLCCKCIICRECIQKWKEQSKQIDNSADVICGFCNKQTDPKINSFQDLKAAQQFAFLFAEPETLFERQIDIIKFQRKQGQKYIQYLQNQVSNNQQELSFIYENYPQIKKEISLRKGNISIIEEQQSKQPNSCINFKGSQAEQVQQRNISKDQSRQIFQQENQDVNNIQAQIIHPQLNIQQRNADFRMNQRQQQPISNRQQLQQDNQNIINNQNFKQQLQNIPNQYNNCHNQTPAVFNGSLKNQNIQNQTKNGFITPINANNMIKSNKSSGGINCQDFQLRKCMQLNQNLQPNQNNSIDYETRQQSLYYETSFQDSKVNMSNENTLQTSKIQQILKPEQNQTSYKSLPFKENINQHLNTVYTSYNQNLKQQQLNSNNNQQLDQCYRRYNN